MTGAVLEPAWFERPSVEVARDLLGALLSTDRGPGRVVLRVTEVEAYAGSDDPASHAFTGRTGRNASMYLAGGRLYVYRHLGLHHCVNVVTGPAGVPGAVLIRAGEVVDGADLARERRATAGVVRRDIDLARGPARLAVALGIRADDDGRALTTMRTSGGPAPPIASPGDLHLVVGNGRPHLCCGPRVGVSLEAREPDRFGWRFWLPADPTVSVDRGPARSARSGRRKPVTPDARRTAH